MASSVNLSVRSRGTMRSRRQSLVSSGSYSRKIDKLEKSIKKFNFKKREAKFDWSEIQMAYQYMAYIFFIFFLYSTVYIFFLHSSSGYFEKTLVSWVKYGITTLSKDNIKQIVGSTSNQITFFFGTVSQLL